MKRMIIAIVLVLCGADSAVAADNAQAIDRQALVTRHNVVLDGANPETALQVGNGEFAFTADAVQITDQQNPHQELRVDGWTPSFAIAVPKALAHEIEVDVLTH